MENIAGWARVLAMAKVQQEQTKPFLRKPFLKYGQCLAIEGYFFELGAILAAKHREHLDAFAHSFLGLYGKPGAIKRVFSEAIKDELALLKAPMSFFEYVAAYEIKRFNYSGDRVRFLVDYGMQKIDPTTAAELGWGFATQGANLGAMHPDVARNMFDHTYKPVDKAAWDRARAAGLDIPAEQGTMTYAEVEENENHAFMAYCQECCPSLHSILAG